MAWTNQSKNSASFSNTSKNSAEWAKEAKSSVTAHLWSPNNDNIWGEDNLPWQDEATVVETNWTNQEKS